MKTQQFVIIAVVTTKTNWSKRALAYLTRRKLRTFVKELHSLDVMALPEKHEDDLEQATRLRCRPETESTVAPPQSSSEVELYR